MWIYSLRNLKLMLPGVRAATSCQSGVAPRAESSASEKLSTASWRDAPEEPASHVRSEGRRSAASANSQYSVTKILTIWALVTVPMPLLAFVVAPAIHEPGTTSYMLTVWFLMIGGMIWQFILSMVLLAREGALSSWAAFRERIWLRAPRDPKSGRRSFKAFWWLIPAFLAYTALEVSPVGTFVGELILIPLPSLSELPDLNLAVLAVPELKGAWWLLGVALISCLFNYLLGEELLFRGVLLPKMAGAFGKWDWVANSVLFALYHLHRPTQALGFILGTMAWVLPSRYYRSSWFAVILHGIEAIPLLIGVTLVVSGGAA